MLIQLQNPPLLAPKFKVIDIPISASFERSRGTRGLQWDGEKTWTDFVQSFFFVRSVPAASSIMAHDKELRELAGELPACQ